NWWGIIKTGLRLRPTNVAINGKMFGMGTYFAPKASKSIGYTSMNGSYWVGGGSQFGFLALFDTAYGKPWFPDSHSESFGTLNYEKLQKLCPGADCLHAKAGMKYRYASTLRNDEVIFYKEEQMPIRYLVELKA
ncbi:MAG: poly(ADP-ribose) polymerase catalytic domain-containing protein, partial [Lachnospiraceae bacterium]|nr:poly(ADP-ribose) polymerase catalytic domain-containing protein [Lachnospiraceae bacterium]